jgi:hypothetical protein
MKQIIIELKAKSQKLKTLNKKKDEEKSLPAEDGFNLSDKVKVGEFVTIKITKTIAFKLYGKIIVT